MLYKFVSETEIKPYKGGFVVTKDNILISNPTEEDLRKDDYKDKIETERPVYDEKTQYLESKYINGDVITVVYEVKDIPTEEIITEE